MLCADYPAGELTGGPGDHVVASAARGGAARAARLPPPRRAPATRLSKCPEQCTDAFTKTVFLTALN